MVAHTAFMWLANLLGSDGEVPLNVALSNLAGSASILCWFIVFTPQFWVNYKRQSGESISLVFLYIWLAGDIMNLIGAIMINLLLTMRILAWYYAIADIALILQVYYYRRTSVKASFESVITHSNPEAVAGPHNHNTNGEHAGLISGSTAGINYSSIPSSEHFHGSEHDRVIHKAAMVANATADAGHYGDDLHHHHHHSSALPGSGSSHGRQRRMSSHSTMTTGSGHYRSKVVRRRKLVRKILLVVFPVLIIGFFLWAYHDWLQCTIEGNTDCGRGGGHGKLPPSPRPPTAADGDDDYGVLNMMNGNSMKQPPTTEEPQATDSEFLPLLLGWGSAILYLGSRGPQIYKNWRLKSCEGLSIMMFVFSVFGNVFYVASIFLNSMEWDYLVKNMPWWIGSGGTLVFDFTIFFQFYIYRYNSPLSEALKEAATTGELTESAMLATAETEDEEDDEEGEGEGDGSDTSSAATLGQKKKNSTNGGPQEVQQQQQQAEVTSSGNLNNV
ncbi:hypothetical protein BG004_005488 [Podila humilis]|nr:hypothetical protein BG004_005488 [Podila humilis]